VSYDVAYDGVAVGHALASTLVDRLKRLHQKHGANIVMLDGDLTDPNAVLFKATAHEVFDPLVSRGALTIAAEYETPWWQPEAAQAEMEEALQLGIRVDGVYAANDGLASGAIAAMKAAGILRLPPVTGQDAELSAIQRFLVGEQYMTVYRPVKPLAEAAALLAFDLATGKRPPKSTSSNTINNGVIDVPAWLFTPVVVTRNNIGSTIVRDGFWTVQEICTPEYAAACAVARLK